MCIRDRFRTVVSILCGVAGLFLGASLNNAIGGCIPVSYTHLLSDSVPRIKTFEELLRPYGIKETVRTGSIAMQKGGASMKL